MDKIKTTDCYVPVDVNERFPEQKSICLKGDKKLTFEWSGKDVKEMKATHWLEKKEGVIVLTPSELENIKSDAEWAAYNSGYIEGRKSTFD